MRAGHSLVVPAGAAVAAGYYPGAAAAVQGANSPVGASLVAGPEHKPDLVLDERHCQHVEDNRQCKSWPVSKVGIDNPMRYCVGHLKKANSGADTRPDQGVRTDAS